MSEEDAYERGARAFENGVKRAPVLDQAMVAGVGRTASWSGLVLLDAWLRGWDCANLSNLQGVEDGS